MAVYRQLAMCLRMRKLRENAGMSQQDVADRLHISQAAYSRMESGETDVTLNRLLRLSDVYGVQLTELLKGL